MTPLGTRSVRLIVTHGTIISCKISMRPDQTCPP
jgi:hypothetical protein